MTTNDPAPAVPVGVQPEPAEGQWHEYDCGPTFGDKPHWHPAPAVPVVHPEPGDRAIEAFWSHLNEHVEEMPGWMEDAVGDALAIFHAAAVAAPRAERDDRVEEYRETTRDTVNHLYATIDRAVEAEADRDRLAGQVAAIRALHRRAQPPVHTMCHECGFDYPCRTIRALVASSPTTPEAKK